MGGRRPEMGIWNPRREASGPTQLVYTGISEGWAPNDELISFGYWRLQAWFVGWPLWHRKAKMGPWKADGAGGGGVAVCQMETGV